jgi:hypothetical protein
MKPKFYLPFLAVVSTGITLIGTTLLAGAEFRVNTGTSGDYAYELWRSDDGWEYTLKIWYRRDYPDGSVYRHYGAFESSREALDYFECHYADNQSACDRLSRY